MRLDGREHGVTLNQVGTAKFLSAHHPEGVLTDLLSGAHRHAVQSEPQTFSTRIGPIYGSDKGLRAVADIYDANASISRL